MQPPRQNIDRDTVRDFGREWQRFDQTHASGAELERTFSEYFSVFPWERLPPGAIGFDAGCGSGRWAAFVAPRVGHLHCIDASEMALAVAKSNLSAVANATFHVASIDAMPLADGSVDFGYSLGVLHHLPDPEAGLATCVRKLKPGSPMLIYIYYALDNRPAWFRALWRTSDLLRSVLSRAPFRLKSAIAELIAATVYWPCARAARLWERAGGNAGNWPLAEYRWRSYYSMRNDALDRFGTRVEHRMSRVQIKEMMERSGLHNVQFSTNPPYWCAVGLKR